MFNRLKNILRHRLFRCMEEDDITYSELIELKSKERSNLILLDVRSIQEYKENHLDGAIQIADYEINFKARQFLTDKTKVIVVYCQSGSRSKKACKQLRSQGYEKVYNLYGGLDNI